MAVARPRLAIFRDIDGVAFLLEPLAEKASGSGIVLHHENSHVDGLTGLSGTGLKPLIYCMPLIVPASSDRPKRRIHIA